MRTSLLPGLLNSVINNLFQGVLGLKLFEVGEVFYNREGQELPEERRCLAGVLTQPFSKDTWYQKERRVDIWDVKGTVEGLLAAFGLERIMYKKSRYPGYDPGMLVEGYVGKTRVLRFGRLAREVLKALDLLDRGEAFAFEVDLDQLRSIMPPRIEFVPLPKYPAVLRDLSLVVDRAIEASAMEDVIRKRAGGLVESIEIFDLYEGDKIPEGKKAIGFRISFRSRERTLDGQEVNEIFQRIVEDLRELVGARLRE
jgi:phenylalanyl-tRNA synthetase beta chain